MPRAKSQPLLKPFILPADVQRSCFYAVDNWAIRHNLGTVTVVHRCASPLPTTRSKGRIGASSLA